MCLNDLILSCAYWPPPIHLTYYYYEIIIFPKHITNSITTLFKSIICPSLSSKLCRENQKDRKYKEIDDKKDSRISAPTKGLQKYSEEKREEFFQTKSTCNLKLWLKLFLLFYKKSSNIGDSIHVSYN